MRSFELKISLPSGEVICKTGIGDVGAHVDAAYDMYGICGVFVRALA